MLKWIDIGFDVGGLAFQLFVCVFFLWLSVIDTIFSLSFSCPSCIYSINIFFCTFTDLWLVQKAKTSKRNLVENFMD